MDGDNLGIVVVVVGCGDCDGVYIVIECECWKLYDE